MLSRNREKGGTFLEREERRKEYLDKFLGAFAENGLDRTSIKKLAAAAGINEASIYQYFRNKDAIVVECVQRYFDTVRERIFPLLTDTRRPLGERVREAERRRFRLEKRGRFVIQVLAHPLYGGLCSGARREFQEELAKLGRRLFCAEGAGGDARSMTFLMYSALAADSICGGGHLLRRRLLLLLGEPPRGGRTQIKSPVGVAFSGDPAGEAEEIL